MCNYGKVGVTRENKVKSKEKVKLGKQQTKKRHTIRWENK